MPCARWSSGPVRCTPSCTARPGSSLICAGTCRERAVPKDLLSISGYWRRGKNEDGWQAEKAATKAAEVQS
jgi:hypothetical protein